MTALELPFWWYVAAVAFIAAWTWALRRWGPR